MTQTTTPRPVTIAVEDLRPGDVIVTPEGVRCYAAFDVEVTDTEVLVWTAVRDQEAGRPRNLKLHKGTTVLIAGPALETTEQPALEATPKAVMAALPATVHLIDAGAVAPGVVKAVLLNSDHAVAAKNALLQAGFDVTRTAETIYVMVPVD